MKKNRIPFYIGKENAPYLEKDILNAPLFKEQYNAIVERMTNYLEASKVILDDTNVNPITYPSNIIAINGDRGAGKTSMMMSIINFLTEKGPEEPYVKKLNHLLVLDVIDPSFFSDKSNPLQVLIAQLYKKFKEYIREHSRYDIDSRNEIVILFEKIQKCLHLMQVEWSADCTIDVDDLEYLAATVDIRKHIEDMIKKLLNLLEKQFLLIPIDDIDLNTKYAYNMMEYLRKYFTSPRVLILFAVNMNQLHSVVYQYFYEDLQQSIKSNLNPQDIAQMADRYLIKLIPLKNRINLQNLSTNLNQEIGIYKDNDDDKNLLYVGILKDLLLRLIYNKTKYVFLNKKHIANYIIPHNLRELKMLLSLLISMPDIEEDNNEKLQNNQWAFKNYFYTIWVNRNLKPEQKKIIYTLKEVDDFSLFNKMVIQLLSSLYETELSSIYRYIKNGEKSDKMVDLSIARICDEDNYNYNISLGDVLALCSYIESKSSSEQTVLFLFALRTVYTFLLQDSYQEQISEEEIIRYIKYLKNPQEEYYISKYQLILSGTAINSDYNSFLPFSKKKYQNRLYRNFKISTISEASDVELFDMLCCMYSWEDKKISAGLNYRKRNNRFYKRDFSNVHEFGCDFFAWTYNLPYILECLKRYGFIWESTVDNSLYSMIIKWMYDKMEISNQVEISDEKMVRMWFDKTCITSIDDIEHLLNRLKEVNYHSPKTMFKRIFKEMKLFTNDVTKDEINENKKIRNTKFEIISKMGEAETFMPMFFVKLFKVRKKNLSFLVSKVSRYKEVNDKKLLMYILSINENVPLEVKTELRELLQKPEIQDLIKHNRWKELALHIRKIKYDYYYED